MFTHSAMGNRKKRFFIIISTKLVGCVSMLLLYVQWLQSSPSSSPASLIEDYEPWPPPLPPPHRRLNHLLTSHGNNTSAAQHLSAYIHLYNATSSSAADSPSSSSSELLHCPLTRTQPPFYVCAFPPDQDRYISAGLLSAAGVWEPYITALFQRALHDHPNAIVIDVGANIGYYSLLAATMGHPVIAIEPADDNVVRLHQGAVRNKKHVTILHNAVYDRHINVSLTASRDNQGGRWITKPKTEAAAPLIQTIVLDDVVPLIRSHQAIIKLDIEGFECRALARVQQLFAKLHVPFLFMEWRKMFLNQSGHRTACSTRRMAGLAAMLTERGYIPFEVRTGFQLNPENKASTTWRVGDVYWRHHSAKPIQDPY